MNAPFLYCSLQMTWNSIPSGPNVTVDLFNVLEGGNDLDSNYNLTADIIKEGSDTVRVS